MDEATDMTPAELLSSMGACGVAVAWARNYDTPAAAWTACMEPAWMLWYLIHACAPPDITGPLVERLDYCDSASARVGWELPRRRTSLERLDYCDEASALRLIRSQFPTPPPPRKRALADAARALEEYRAAAAE